MTAPLHHPHETSSNAIRDQLPQFEPRALRTYTPTQAVLARSAGVFHWTPEGRQLYDFTSGVLVANLGHNPESLDAATSPTHGLASRRFRLRQTGRWTGSEYFAALPMTAYNAVTPRRDRGHAAAWSRRCKAGPAASGCEQVLWAASGSEAIQKALWAALARDRTRDMILATRYGFHGKKGLAGAVTGCETDHDRDPRVRFISFPMTECARRQPCATSRSTRRPIARNSTPCVHQFGRRLSVLITEPYLGGGGSYHPPTAYLQMLQAFCRENDIVFILDEVQANFGRTGDLFALRDLRPGAGHRRAGQGAGQRRAGGRGGGPGGPVRAASTTAKAPTPGAPTRCAAPPCWPRSTSSPPATCSARSRRSLGHHRGGPGAAEGAAVRRPRPRRKGRHGLGRRDARPRRHDLPPTGPTPSCWPATAARTDGDGIHLLGPLAKKVVRIAPPLVISETQAHEVMDLMTRLLSRLTETPRSRSEKKTAGSSL